MAIAELVSAEQYLHTSFEHDAEFVEGRIVERPLPTWEHSDIQGHLIEVLRPMGRKMGFYTVPEQRVRIRPNLVRIPDVCVVTEKPIVPTGGRIVTKPPYLCVEIHSPDDTTSETLEKVREYLAFGVEWVWVIDPLTRTGQIHSPSAVKTVDNGIFSTDRFKVDLSAAEL
jgi:Uma2 family endonuclease